MPLLTEQEQSPSKPIENQNSLGSLTTPPVMPYSVFIFLMCKRTNMNLSSDLEPLPNCSPQCCSQTWLYHCTRGVTIAAERRPRLQGPVCCLLLTLPFLFRGQDWVSTHQFIFYTLFIITSGRQNSDFTLPRDLEQNVILGNLSLCPCLNPSHRLVNE